MSATGQGPSKATRPFAARCRGLFFNGLRGRRISSPDRIRASPSKAWSTRAGRASSLEQSLRLRQSRPGKNGRGLGCGLPVVLQRCPGFHRSPKAANAQPVDLGDDRSSALGRGRVKLLVIEDWRQPNGDLKAAFRADPLDGRMIHRSRDRPDLDGAMEAPLPRPVDLCDEKAGFGLPRRIDLPDAEGRERCLQRPRSSWHLL